MKKKSRTSAKPGGSISISEDLVSAKTGTTAQRNGKAPRKVAGAKQKDDDVLDERELLSVLAEVRNGNFSVRMPIDKLGVSGKICDTLNEIIALNQTLGRATCRESAAGGRREGA